GSPEAGPVTAYMPPCPVRECSGVPVERVEDVHLVRVVVPEHPQQGKPAAGVRGQDQPPGPWHGDADRGRELLDGELHEPAQAIPTGIRCGRGREWWQGRGRGISARGRTPLGGGPPAGGVPCPVPPPPRGERGRARCSARSRR